MLQIKDLEKMKQRSEVRTQRGKERAWSKTNQTPRDARGWRDIRSMTGASIVRGQRSAKTKTLTGSVNRRATRGRRGWNLANTGKASMEAGFGYVICSEWSTMNIERLLGWVNGF